MASHTLLSLLTIGFLGLLGVANCYGTTFPNYESRNDFMSSINTSSSHGSLSFISRIFNIIFVGISLPLLPAVKPVAFLIQLLSPNGLHAIASAFLSQLSHSRVYKQEGLQHRFIDPGLTAWDLMEDNETDSLLL